jgi:hypothetical protein
LAASMISRRKRSTETPAASSGDRTFTYHPSRKRLLHRHVGP